MQNCLATRCNKKTGSDQQSKHPGDFALAVALCTASCFVCDEGYAWWGLCPRPHLREQDSRSDPSSSSIRSASGTPVKRCKCKHGFSERPFLEVLCVLDHWLTHVRWSCLWCHPVLIHTDRQNIVSDLFLLKELWIAKCLEMVPWRAQKGPRWQSATGQLWSSVPCLQQWNKAQEFHWLARFLMTRQLCPLSFTWFGRKETKYWFVTLVRRIVVHSCRTTSLQVHALFFVSMASTHRQRDRKNFWADASSRQPGKHGHLLMCDQERRGHKSCRIRHGARCSTR